METRIIRDVVSVVYDSDKRTFKVTKKDSTQHIDGFLESVVVYQSGTATATFSVPYED